MTTWTPNSNIAADFATHHIEGIAREGHTPFSAPLISQIDENFWQGGCIHGVSLGGLFKHVVSLYPWEQFNPGGDLASFVSVRLYDAGEIPDPEQLYTLARWINVCRKHGATLVHCQAGLNRSGLLAGLALVLDGMPADTAIQTLRDKRSPAVLCNATFANWLRQQAVA